MNQLIKPLLTALLALTPGLALAAGDPTCVYVFGQVDSITVTTPAVLVYVPDSSVTTQPIIVDVDQTQQIILGYTQRVTGIHYGVDGQSIFVAGLSQSIPSFAVTLPEIPLASQSRCVQFGVTTPAVPVYVPASVLTTPGASVDVPSIALNILGNPVTTPGHLLTVDGHTIVVPDFATAVPGVPVGTPNQSVTVDVNGSVQQARYMAPNQ